MRLVDIMNKIDLSAPKKTFTERQKKILSTISKDELDNMVDIISDELKLTVLDMVFGYMNDCLITKKDNGNGGIFMGHNVDYLQLKYYESKKGRRDSKIKKSTAKEPGDMPETIAFKKLFARFVVLYPETAMQYRKPTI